MIALRGRAGGREDGRRSARRIRRAGALGLALVAAVSLSACAAGQHAGTAEETSVIDGTDASVGTMHLRAVAVAPPSDNSYPKGGDAALQLVLVNSGTAVDSLTKVSTSMASSVDFYPNAAAVPAASTSAPAGTGTPTDATGTPAANTADSAVPAIPVSGGQRVSVGFAPNEPTIVLHGLTSQLFPAQSFPVTFTFTNAGTVTVYVAVYLAKPPASPATAPINVGGPAA